MSKLRNLRDIGLVLAGVVAGACLSSLPKQASSASQEGDAIAGAIIIEKDKRNRQQHQPDNAEGWGGITRYSSYYRPSHVSSRLFPDHDDCDVAKLGCLAQQRAADLLALSRYGSANCGEH